MSQETVKLSKFLSYVLRHRPDEIGLHLDGQGWVNVEYLLKQANAHNVHLTQALLEEIVAANNKQRFSFSNDSQKIRANQGHSVAIDLGLEPQIPPVVLYHGTALHFLESIFATGIHPGNRHHVHLSRDTKTALKVGRRHGEPVVLQVAAQQMHANGHLFFCSDNGVWLTDQVAPPYLTQLYEAQLNETH
ncbi:MAG: RNA 2'-phosphotransferase [Leptolyngbyaceae cyanobacterium MO_188.B28]|nr:RNA 2'-phosphotransferase [Leptolyngbyaceae cyanobacterium MO_188.B28]